MKREIKFRAWHYDDGMLYFDFDSFQKDYHDQYGNLMQYTGLCDRNGKEIYESDLNKRHNYLYEVVWSEEDAGFMHKLVARQNSFTKEWEPEESMYFTLRQDEINETIGNIYEHPHLLNPAAVGIEAAPERSEGTADSPATAQNPIL